MGLKENELYLKYNCEKLYGFLKTHSSLPKIVYLHEEKIVEFLRFVITNKIGITTKIKIYFS